VEVHVEAPKVEVEVHKVEAPKVVHKVEAVVHAKPAVVTHRRALHASYVPRVNRYSSFGYGSHYGGFNSRRVGGPGLYRSSLAHHSFLNPATSLHRSYVPYVPSKVHHEVKAVVKEEHHEEKKD
jgi:hypothetical protein